jgi:hypothetical protein
MIEAHSLNAPQSVRWLQNVIPCNDIRMGWSHILLEAVHLSQLFFNVKDDYLELQKKKEGGNSFLQTLEVCLFLVMQSGCVYAEIRLFWQK